MKFLALLLLLSACKTEPVKPVEAPVVKTGTVQEQMDAVVSGHLSSYVNLTKYNPSVKYWQAVIKGIASAESNFNVTETYWEKTLGKNGIDPINGSKYLSEGLLQLSYSDKQVYGCNFDWDADKGKAEKDKTKMIFDVENNITCGLKILDKLVPKHGGYIFNSGNYWAVLMPKNKRHSEFLSAFKKFNK